MRLAGCLVTLLCAALSAEDWSRFRGPDGSGLAPDSAYPTEFGPQKNLVWRTPTRAGKSSPVFTAHHIFLTAYESGKLYTLCFDRATGKLLWERSIERARKELINSLNEPASNTAVTDGRNVYAFFREYGLVSYGPNGELRWKTPLGPFANTEGLSASPVIVDGVLVMLVEQTFGSYLAGFDLANGETRWKTDRDERVGYNTPVTFRPRNKPAQIVAGGEGRLSGYDPKTGRRLWLYDGFGPVALASPVAHENQIYSFGYGYDSTTPFEKMLGQFDKNGDSQLTPDEYGENNLLTRVGFHTGNRDGLITREEWYTARDIVKKPSSMVGVVIEDGKTPREIWRYERSFIGVVPSPLYFDGLVYFVKNGGILTAMDAKTGEAVKAARLPRVADNFLASPVASADGRLFLASEKGKLVVVRAAKEWEVLAVNDLNEDTFATPALLSGRIYIRTLEALYCFGL
ncbi:MAG: PQQ-binding-like beta-propeller repeat protein [Bryobacterales bacterium]|nr:PQQ-binding-like beta-propeller repeat protein [Bryobacterales bacterium]